MWRVGKGLAAAVFAAALSCAGSVEAQQRIVIYSSNDATLNKLVASEFTAAYQQLRFGGKLEAAPQLTRFLEQLERSE